MTFATCGHFEKITWLPTMPFYLVTILTLCLTEMCLKKEKKHGMVTRLAKISYKIFLSSKEDAHYFSGTLKPCPRGQSGLDPNCTGNEFFSYSIQVKVI